MFYQLLMFKETVTYFSCDWEELLANICRLLHRSTLSSL